MVYDVLFVRDYDGVPSGPNVYPIDYGIERRYIEACADPEPLLQRPVDVMFYGTLSTAWREQKLMALRSAGFNVKYGAYKFNNPDDKWSYWIYGRYTHDPNYYRALTTAKMIFCPIGAGCTCFRHMEAYAAKAIPVIQKIPDYIQPMHKFVHGENCILWENTEDLVAKVRHYLTHENEMASLWRKCQEFADNNLTTKHVAQNMLDRVRNHCELGGN